MKKLILLFIALITLVSLNACSDDNSPIFTAKPDVDGIVFTNSFAANYLISQATKENVADRFIWESADFGVPTNITYELQGAINPDFTTFKVVGTTSENNLAVSIAKLLEFAKDLGLDDSPATTNTDGSANNTGQVYFRVKATTGTTGTTETFSVVQVISIKWIETVVVAGNSCPSLFALGDALTDIGWNFKPTSEMKCTNNVLQVKARLAAGNFRFFQESGSWTSDLKYAHYKAEGYTIDANLADAEDGANFKFIGTPGIYTITIDNTKKTIILTASSNLWTVGGAVPGGWNFNASTIEFVEATPDIWSASITLSKDIFRFFHVYGTWDTKNNFAFYEDAGFTIDPNLVKDEGSDANFKFVGTPGTYKLTINAIAKTITLE